MPGSATFHGPLSERCPEGIYRTFLSRDISVMSRTCLFIMLNPSTATATTNDPTITRCIGFADRENCGTLWVCNLFALRSTDPAELYAHPAPEGDPENLAEIAVRATQADLVVCAWGRHGKLRNRSSKVRTTLMLNGIKPWCLKKSGDGVPHHPLYLRADAPLVAL